MLVGRRSRRLGSVVVLVALMGVPLSPGAHGGALTVDEICAPNEDPCVIDDPLEVGDAETENLVLDFGTRALRITGSGRIDVASPSVAILCRELVVDVGNSDAIVARRNVDGALVGGAVTIDTLRRCSLETHRSCERDQQCSFGSCTATACAGDPSIMCSDDAGCRFGECSSVCTLREDVSCSTDAECNLGTCDLLTRSCTGDSSRNCFNNAQCNFGRCESDPGRCAGRPSVTCETSADCELGPCSMAVCTSRDAGQTRECTGDADCSAGACSVGGGGVSLDGKLRANAATPGSVSIASVGDIVFERLVTVEAGDPDSDGGDVTLTSQEGSVALSGIVNASSGSQSAAGTIRVTAGSSVVIDGPVEISGGIGDGGYLEVEAGDDIHVSARVDANSRVGGGYGGEVCLSSDGGDVVLATGTELLVSGSIDRSGDGLTGGDGGTVSLYAESRISIEDGVLVRANGEAPDGVGGYIEIAASGSLDIAGTLRANALGLESSGGYVDLCSFDGAVRIARTARLTATGGAQGYDGNVTFYASGDVEIAGNVDTRAPTITRGSTPEDASVRVTAGGYISVSGDVLCGAGGAADMEACSISLEPNGRLSAPDGYFYLLANEQISVHDDAKLLATGPEGEGRIWISYGDPEQPPLLDGLVAPAPKLEALSLEPCADCTAGSDEQCTTTTTVPASTTTTTMQVSTTTTPGPTSTTTVPVPACGNGVVDDDEDCDDGDDAWLMGEYCAADCRRIACGDVDDSSTTTATDALIVLRAAVGLTPCDVCVCDVDGGGPADGITAGDALRVLRYAVGAGGLELICPQDCNPS